MNITYKKDWITSDEIINAFDHKVIDDNYDFSYSSSKNRITLQL